MSIIRITSSVINYDNIHRSAASFCNSFIRDKIKYNQYKKKKKSDLVVIAIYKELASTYLPKNNLSPNQIEILEYVGFSACKKCTAYRPIGRHCKTCKVLKQVQPFNTLSANETNAVCSICIDPIAIGIITPCGHSFHSNCFIRWSNKSQSCPHCRTTIY